MRRYKEPEKVEIVYFSGTGGTKRAADTFAEAFKGQGVSIECQEIHARRPFHPHEYDLLLMLYPVYAMNAPRPVYEFINKLPSADRALAAVISVSGGGEISPNTASRHHCIQLLKKKGYRIPYEQMLIMPSNFIIPTPKPLSLLLLKLLPVKIDKIVTDLLSGTVKRTNPCLIDRIISCLTEIQKVGSRLYGRQIRCRQTCNGCGLCAKACPTANIKLKNGRPVFAYRCCLCLRCVYDCPRRALEPAIAKGLILKEGFSIRELERELPEFQGLDASSYVFEPGFAALKEYFLEK